MSAKEDIKRGLIRVLVGVLCVIALGLILAILGGASDVGGRLSGTGLTIAVYSVLALASLRVLDTRPGLATTGFAVYVLAAVIALAGLWTSSDNSHVLARPAYALFVLSLGIAHATLLESRQRPTDTQAITNVLNGTIGCIALLTFLLMAAILKGDNPSDGYWQLVGIMVVLTALGTLLLPLLRKLEQAQAAPPEHD